MILDLPAPTNCADIKTYPLTDLGNAERFVDRWGDYFVFCPGFQKYLVWTGTHWEPDADLCVERWAAETVRNLRDKATLNEKRQGNNLLKWADRSEHEARLKAMVKLARPMKTVAVDDLDQNPYLLNCLNGTLDLKTGELRYHDQADRITKAVEIEFDPEATCPRFERFLTEVLSPEHAAYLQRLVGYCLTGDVGEQSFFIFIGEGSNGKSVLTEVLRSLLGPFAANADPATLTEAGRSKHSTGLARLRGKRLATIGELPEKQKMDEALLKQVTGGEPVTARHLYRDHFEYHPQFKIVIVTNNEPQFDELGFGLWRRVRMITFDRIIAAEDQDPKLREKLLEELPGILAWAVRGCLEWQRAGLQEPDSMRSAVLQYQNRQERDGIGGFFEARCSFGPGLKVSTADLKNDYSGWCRDRGMSLVGAKEFANRLRARGCSDGKSNGVRVWKGVALIESPQRRPQVEAA